MAESGCLSAACFKLPHRNSCMQLLYNVGIYNVGI